VICNIRRWQEIEHETTQISGSHSGFYEEYSLLGYDAVWSGRSSLIQSVPNTRKLRIAWPTGNLLGRGMCEVVSRTTTKIPALILWLENICSSSKRNRKVTWEGNSADVTENAQSGFRWPLNTPCIFEGIPAKCAEVRQLKLKQPHSLSRIGELQQCEVCSCTLSF
jgi:hypothetical protein